MSRCITLFFNQRDLAHSLYLPRGAPHVNYSFSLLYISKMNKNLFILVLISYRLAAQDIQLPASKLNAPVEIIIDTWEYLISMQRMNTTVFAQGFQAAKDRLFHLEMFRRQANGTMAEVLGESEMNRDLGARLFKFAKYGYGNGTLPSKG